MTKKEAKNVKVGNIVFYVEWCGVVKPVTIVDGHKICNGIEVGIMNVKANYANYYRTKEDADRLAAEIRCDMSNHYGF